MVSVNNKILCLAPASTSIKLEAKNGFARVKQKVSMIALGVVCDTTIQLNGGGGKVPAGSHIYLSGEAINHQYLKDIFFVNGTACVLVPWDQVLLITEPNEKVIEIGQSKGESSDSNQIQIKTVE